MPTEMNPQSAAILRRGAIDAVHEREEPQRLILDHLPVGVIQADIAGNAFYQNPKFVELFGYTLDQFSTLAEWWLLAHPEPAYRERVIAAWDRRLAEAIAAGGEIRPMEVAITCADGTVKDVRVTARVMGELLFATFIDLTERKASEERHRTLLMMSPDGISVTDRTGRILACNEQFAHMHGFDRSAEMIGRHAQEFARPEAFAALFREIAAAFASGRSVAREIEVEVLRRDGTSFAAEYSVAQVPWPDAPSGAAFISNIRDITKRKEMAAELERHRSRLEELVQERTVELQAEIARRTAAQEALSRSEGNLGEAQRIARMGSWERDLGTGAFYPSDGLLRLFGLPREDPHAAQASVWNALHPEDRAAVEAAYARLLETGETFDARHRIVLPSGETRLVRALAEIVRDAAGRRVGVHGLVQDVTEQEQAREALDRRVAELSNLQALGRPVSFKLPLEEIIRIVLDKIVALAALDLAQLFLLRADQLHTACTRTAQGAPAMSAPGCAAAEHVCRLAVRSDGGLPVYVADIEDDARCAEHRGDVSALRSLAAFPLRAEDTIIGALVVGARAPDAFAGGLTFLETAADQLATRLHNALLHREIRERAAGLEEIVTERTRELQIERDRSQAILETLGESVIVTDLDGQVLFINPATTTLTGYTRDDLLGQPLWRTWSAQALAETRPEVQRALHTGQGWHGEIAGQRRDGSPYAAALTGTPLYDANAPHLPVGAAWVQRDITLLKEAARLKDQFVANVSHELRTPISIIALSCDNLETFYDRLQESQRKRVLRDIHEQARVLSSLVEDTLDISRIDGGHVSRTRSRVDLAQLVRGEVEKCSPLAGKRSQRIGVSAAKPVSVLGNEAELRQIVRNLLDNAIKYTPDGGRIRCTCEIRPAPPAAAPGAGAPPAGPWAVVEVTDGGIGIAAEELPYVFERFYRAHGESEIPGTGLGLSIARELAALHGGRITAASVPGRGSTFTVYLPLWRGEG